MRQLLKCSHVVIAAFLDHDKVQKTDLLKTTAAYKKWMKSSITTAASSVCKHEIFTDRLNKIQLRTVWCAIFYFCSKHCTFAWICVDFSCKEAFISYPVMSEKTRVLMCCCLFVWLNWVLRKFGAIKSWVMIGDFREKTWLDHCTKTTLLPKRLRSTKSYVVKAIDHTFYGFTGVITHAGCWEITRKAQCKSRAEGEIDVSAPRWLRWSVIKAIQLHAPWMHSIKVKGLHKCLLQSRFAWKYTVVSCRLISLWQSSSVSDTVYSGLIINGNWVVLTVN